MIQSMSNQVPSYLFDLAGCGCKSVPYLSNGVPVNLPPFVLAVSPFAYDLYLQMRSERHMDLVTES